MALEDKVQVALRLLREAGCLDMVREGVLSPLRPARRAASGVAAGILAFSLLRCVNATKATMSLRGGAERTWERLQQRAGRSGPSSVGIHSSSLGLVKKNRKTYVRIFHRAPWNILEGRTQPGDALFVDIRVLIALLLDRYNFHRECRIRHLIVKRS
ncbi:hypothetical protein NDU88_002002 [Pleurodeles waltl]|uniref:Uncharacterized protein n=1 Tax=Pleurodeles waltl TaxID=8319 RepID=A0AAV7P5G7_PLEWA|nr:hypothetical protein NDU88_002002 [Pleurodeles waltl]